MSTQKKESTQAQGQAEKTAAKQDSNAQRTPVDAIAPKGKGADAQRKTASGAGERENASKRATMNSKKH